MKLLLEQSTHLEGNATTVVRKDTRHKIAQNPRRQEGRVSQTRQTKEKGVIIAVKLDTPKTVGGTNSRMRAKGQSGTSLCKAHKTKCLQPCIVEIVGMMVI